MTNFKATYFKVNTDAGTYFYKLAVLGENGFPEVYVNTTRTLELSGDTVTSWEHCAGNGAKVFLDRLVLELAGLVEKKFFTMLESDPLAKP